MEQKKNIRATKAWKNLKKSMLENLAARGLVEEAYAEKVDEYMALYEQRRALEEDIKARGITVLDEKRGMLVENRSVSLEVQVSRQMLNIWSALGFRADQVNRDTTADEDDL